MSDELARRWRRHLIARRAALVLSVAVIAAVTAGCLWLLAWACGGWDVSCG